jgi:hypothetical protein
MFDPLVKKKPRAASPEAGTAQGRQVNIDAMDSSPWRRRGLFVAIRITLIDDRTRPVCLGRRNSIRSSDRAASILRLEVMDLRI